MGPYIHRACESRIAGPAQRRIFARPATAADQRGFSLLEMTTSVGVLLVVLTAAWLLLTVSNDNLNHIDYGGQSSELNRAALASFERDLNHSVLPADEVSSILIAASRQCSMLVDEDNDGERTLVTWKADTDRDALVRVVTQATETTSMPSSVGDFAGGVTTTETVLTGLDWSGSQEAAMFVYKPDARNAWDGDPRKVGLVTFHLRNGLPNSTTNVTDRTAAYRVISLVINGY